MIRRIGFYGDYFRNFYEQQEQKVREKIDFVLDMIANVDLVPPKFLKYLKGTEGMYEIRIITSRKSIRIFCFFDEGQLVILTNCFVKKTRKTPKRN